MPDLAHSIQDRDLSFLHMIAERWGVELQAPDARSALPLLIHGMAGRERVLEIFESLDGASREALAALQRGKGRLPWAEFMRAYGPLREYGPGKRDRERPDLHPISIAETLWYSAFLGRGFFDTPTGPLEFAYIPDDLLGFLPPARPLKAPPPGCPASPLLSANPLPATDLILDQACTLLAALRLGREAPPGTIPTQVLQALLTSAGLLDGKGIPVPEPTRSFLEAPRGEALAHLFRTWLSSSDFNELRLTPGLVCDGEWRNDPLQARKAILDLLRQVPTGEWWDLNAFVQGVRERKPDFQRPAGDYDSWFIRPKDSDTYLRGFEHWNDVDGAMIRFLITGPLHWLGAVDLAASNPGMPAEAFKFSNWSGSLLEGTTPAGFAREEGKMKIYADGRLKLPRLVPRAVRYQIARFCSWSEESADEYHYRVTPASLEKAQRQGLRLNHLLSLLRKHGATPPTPSLVRALEHWEEDGIQARFEEVVVLRCVTPEVLTALRHSKAARFLGDPLGPTAVIVPAGAREKVVLALIELGFLAEAGFDDERV